MSVSWKRFGIPVLMVFAVSALLALLMSNLTAVTADSSGVDARNTSIVVLDELNEGVAAPMDVIAESAAFASAQNETRGSTATSAVPTDMYIVVMEDDSLVNYHGGVATLDGTSRQATGADQLDASAEDSVRYLDYLDTRRGMVINLASTQVDRELDIAFEYGATFVGFAAEMTAKEAEAIAEMADVAFVEKEKISYPQTDAGPIWAGASEIWGGDWAGLNYTVSMDGASQVSPVTTNVSGSGVFTYNFYTNLLEYDITVTNPDNVELTAMHIHTGTAGNTGGVVYNFGVSSTTGDISASGSTTLADEHETALVNDGLYVNVHSTPNAAGEVRGQIDLSGSLGEGVVVGIIDTGIDPWNPSFAAVGGDGYVHTNPLGSGNYIGVCDPTNTGGDGVVAYDATFPCNDKLIGVWGYTASDESPRDTDGHGSHTAGTSAGNIVFDSVIDAPTDVYTSDISGVAPHANIIAYDGCVDGGGCSGAALSAAREQALLDGVDVINYSIGSSASTGDFWEDTEALQWLALRDAGVFVATSNGNAGNGDATTGSPADLPWLTSVGANSHNRSFLVSVMVEDSTAQTITVNGQAMATGYGPADIVLSTSYTDTEDARLCAPGAFPAGTFSGEIVVCERGSYGRVAKGQSVLDGGAGGYILAQPDEASGGPGAVAADTHVLPAAHIDYTNYQILRQFLITDGVGTIQATLSGASLDVDDAHGDIMAAFSSRGPNGTDADLIVPSVTAPGRSIWAAYAQGDSGDGDFTYNAINGTSMSSPHVAGAGALLTALHPDWTPAEMQSALMLTARDTVLDDDGVTVATPFAQGSGHIDVAVAAMSPLIMDVTTAEYEGADPDEGGTGVRDLNTASMGEDQCVGRCTWTRTVENASSETLTWTLSVATPMSITASAEPSSFTLAPGAKQEITVIMTVTEVAIDGEWIFAQLNLDEDSGDYPDAQMPIAVVSTSGNYPETIDLETQDLTGSNDMSNLLSLGITSLYTEVVGLVLADRHEFTVSQDELDEATFIANFFDVLTTTQFISIEVPADSFSVIAEIVETTSPDLDMLLFLDVENDGPDLDDAGDPSSDDYSCMSASSGSAESCEILSPAAGTYYAAIMNYSENQAGGDVVDLATAVVADGGTDEGNFSVSGPSSVGSNEPYTLTLTHDFTSTLTPVSKLYGYFTIGSDASNAGDIATVRVFMDYTGVPSILITDTVDVTLNSGASAVSSVVVSNTAVGVLEWNVNTADPAASPSCNTAADISWLSVAPSAGVLNGFTEETAELTFTATGLLGGVYTDTLCVTSNDPTAELSVIDLTMTVLAPDVSLTPVTTITLVGDSAYSDFVTQTLTISNSGSAPLDWIFAESSDTSRAAIPSVDIPEGLDVDSLIAHSPVDRAAEAARANATTIWTQPASGSGGIASHFFGNFGIGAYSADDFIVDGVVSIDYFNVPGFMSSGAVINDAFNVTLAIYEDDNGSPAGFPEDAAPAPNFASAIWSYSPAPGSTGLSLTGDVIAVDLEAAGAAKPLLTPGRYWLVAYVNDASTSSAVRWNWSQAAASADPNAQLISPAVFGIDNWTSLNALIGWGDLAFTIGGDILCSNVSDLDWVSVDMASGSTASGEETTVVVTLNTAGVKAGDYSGNLCLVSNDPDEAVVNIPLSASISSTAPEAEPEDMVSYTQSDTVGNIVTHTVQITNVSLINDAYNLSMSGTDWTTSLSTLSTNILAPGASETVHIRVNIPADASIGDSDTFTLTTVPGFDPSVATDLVLTTSAVGAVPSLASDMAAMSGQLGDVVTYTVGVTNTGTVTGTFDISVSGYSWMSTASVTSTMSLAPNAGSSFDVVVTIPATATVGMTDTVTVTATDQTATTSTGTLDLTTTVAYEYSAMLPFFVRE